MKLKGDENPELFPVCQCPAHKPPFWGCSTISPSAQSHRCHSSLHRISTAMSSCLLGDPTASLDTPLPEASPPSRMCCHTGYTDVAELENAPLFAIQVLLCSVILGSYKTCVSKGFLGTQRCSSPWMSPSLSPWGRNQAVVTPHTPHIPPPSPCPPEAASHPRQARASM